VPVYNGEAFVAETLDRIAAQTHHDLRVLISLDRSTDDSEAVCRRALSDDRFKLIVQPQRLGWVANVNALIAQVDTPYFCIVPHDDLLDRGYIDALLPVVRNNPSAICAYCDLESFGARHIRHQQDELRGGWLTRAVTFLLHHFAAVAFRGIVNRRADAARRGLPAGLRHDFAADTVWMGQLALDGELRRVPSTLYAKRYHDASVHAHWLRIPREEAVARWADHAAACTRAAIARTTNSDERDLLLAAGFMRATGVGRVCAEWHCPKDGAEVSAAAALFARTVGEPALEHRLPDIVQRPGSGLLRAAIDEHDRGPEPSSSVARRALNSIRRLDSR
jgi:hypothetical protein